jgi:carbamoyl-phosphate synthase large subunit
MEKNPQVLILSANAKVPLIRAFQAAGAVVHGADISRLRAGMVFADQRVILPETGAADFADHLLTYCRDHRIALVLPSRDGDLLPLLRLKPALQDIGAIGLVPNAATIATCLDKIAFHSYCQSNNFPTARRYQPGMSGPLFIRPAVGAGSGAAYSVANADDVRFRNDDEWLAQEFVAAPEYSIDLLCDIEGQPMQAVARRRILTRAGEAQISAVEEQPELTALAMVLAENLRLVGHNVVQAFLHPTRGALLIEVNARFGGASTLSIEAGLNSPARILANLIDPKKGRQNGDILLGLTLLRYPSDHFVRPERDFVEPAG